MKIVFWIQFFVKTLNFIPQLLKMFPLHSLLVAFKNLVNACILITFGKCVWYDISNQMENLRLEIFISTWCSNWFWKKSYMYIYWHLQTQVQPPTPKTQNYIFDSWDWIPLNFPQYFPKFSDSTAPGPASRKGRRNAIQGRQPHVRIRWKILLAHCASVALFFCYSQVEFLNFPVEFTAF